MIQPQFPSLVFKLLQGALQASSRELSRPTGDSAPSLTAALESHLPAFGLSVLLLETSSSFLLCFSQSLPLKLHHLQGPPLPFHTYVTVPVSEFQ